MAPSPAAFAAAVVLGVAAALLVFLLRGQLEQTERAAVFLGDLVLAPMLFVGGALLYTDQAARVAAAATRGRRVSPPADAVGSTSAPRGRE